MTDARVNPRSQGSGKPAGGAAGWRWNIGLLLTLALVACLASATGPDVTASPIDAAVGLWVFHVDGGRFRDHIQLLRVSTDPDSEGRFRLETLPTLDWNGAPTLDLEIEESSGRVRGGSNSWTLALNTGETGFFSVSLSGDTARGTMVILDRTGQKSVFPAVGVRIPVTLIANHLLTSGTVSFADTTPVVLLRVDDLPPSNRDFVSRLRQRSLFGELAIPTAFVGRDGRPTWDEVRSWVSADGFGVAAHSRTHNITPRTDERFIGEVLGSMADLTAQNLATTVFVQQTRALPRRMTPRRIAVGADLHLCGPLSRSVLSW